MSFFNQSLDVTEVRNLREKLGGCESGSCPSQYLRMDEEHAAVLAQDVFGDRHRICRSCILFLSLSCQDDCAGDDLMRTFKRFYDDWGTLQRNEWQVLDP